MAWQTVEADDAIVYDWLLRDDDGDLLGWIIRLDEEGPTHDRTPLGHIDGWACDAAARAAVERVVEVGPLRPAVTGGWTPFWLGSPWVLGHSKVRHPDFLGSFWTQQEVKK
jgi:hypothetical protein